jgi:hypothetical protein
MKRNDGSGNVSDLIVEGKIPARHGILVKMATAF